MFNFIDHLFYIFIPASGCVGRSPTVLFFPGAYNAFEFFCVILLCVFTFLVRVVMSFKISA